MNTPNSPFDAKRHWENIYSSKGPQDVSWYQAVPAASLALFDEYTVPLDARIIDVGGGDGVLVDHLLDRGYTDITVLDISHRALQKAQLRLGERASQAEWIEADATRFEVQRPFDVWHDRAVFHFLTDEAGMDRYLDRVMRYLRPGGLLLLATFSDQGPEKCSGIPVKRYTEAGLTDRLQRVCDPLRCFTVDHTTPFDTVQNFLFCAFRKKV